VRWLKCVLGGCLVLVANSAMAVDFYMVMVDSLNVRQGPSHSGHIITKAPQHQLVLETRREGDWSEIFYLDSHKANVKGWVYNRYIQPQTLTPDTVAESVFAINVSAAQPVCEGRSMITGGSLCYLDVTFAVQSKTGQQTDVQVNCWADFVVPGRDSVTPVQATMTKRYRLTPEGASDTMRLKAGLKQLLDSTTLNVAYYNCAAGQ